VYCPTATCDRITRVRPNCDQVATSDNPHFFGTCSVSPQRGSTYERTTPYLPYPQSHPGRNSVASWSPLNRIQPASLIVRTATRLQKPELQLPNFSLELRQRHVRHCTRERCEPRGCKRQVEPCPPLRSWVQRAARGDGLRRALRENWATREARKADFESSFERSSTLGAQNGTIARNNPRHSSSGPQG
jgi:hypothetical protein